MLQVIECLAQEVYSFISMEIAVPNIIRAQSLSIVRLLNLVVTRFELLNCNVDYYQKSYK